MQVAYLTAGPDAPDQGAIFAPGIHGSRQASALPRSVLVNLLNLVTINQKVGRWR
jgi:hypothetical protein